MEFIDFQSPKYTRFFQNTYFQLNKRQIDNLFALENVDRYYLFLFTCHIKSSKKRNLVRHHFYLTIKKGKLKGKPTFKNKVFFNIFKIQVTFQNINKAFHTYKNLNHLNRCMAQLMQFTATKTFKTNEQTGSI